MSIPVWMFVWARAFVSICIGYALRELMCTKASFFLFSVSALVCPTQCARSPTLRHVTSVRSSTCKSLNATHSRVLHNGPSGGRSLNSISEVMALGSPLDVGDLRTAAGGLRFARCLLPALPAATESEPVLDIFLPRLFACWVLLPAHMCSIKNACLGEGALDVSVYSPGLGHGDHQTATFAAITTCKTQSLPSTFKNSSAGAREDGSCPWALCCARASLLRCNSGNAVHATWHLWSKHLKLLLVDATAECPGAAGMFSTEGRLHPAPDIWSKQLCSILDNACSMPLLANESTDLACSI